ncbi:4-(cytidine 5'-diphospho)-2-C-methyl-D-erythritol kinase [Jannaschia pohangensis]|uniref:4-diphosphocytidyl-2-C-methyl-D-erythritol kinase n=1 Tax=Jannaschia pohangensis TaxID=390807 RepID=A0A1I3MT50_9RHOB|nr:4-(cytidine 5'-diphospho)-2-C-methyl-D-erythritol kinase [Jannaschia pohangensis]SFJ00147.1 4-diphosphocytidyl-2-C-methyl-D-erythritol kinase [Jannaschia pohangensis]
MSEALRGFAPAKVNLTLHVTGRRADGYHLLDSLVAFADVGDGLSVSPGDALRVTGPFAAGVPTDDTNLIRRALALAGQPRAVTLTKALPHPAGIGGGSSDAAAALRLVGADPGVAALLTLGADVPVCMGARAARMRGIGGAVDPVTLPRLHGVLVNPGLAVPTGAVFARMATADNAGHGDLPHWPDATALTDWLSAQRNDLETPALAIAPGIADVLSALRQAGASLARMSGSGATCFGLWPSRIAAEDAAQSMARGGWWVQACSLF